MKFKDFLNEGTWSCPWTKRKADEFINIFNNPIKLKDSTEILYNVCGDDLLYDYLESLKNKVPLDKDVRPEVAKWIEKHWIPNGKLIDRMKRF